jgi:hypothetical protein
MAKKATRTFSATLRKNTEKSGAWLCEFSVRDENGEETKTTSAWTTASAGKRWVKANLMDITGRKSIKMSPVNFDEKEKPTLIMGSLDYKVAV